MTAFLVIFGMQTKSKVSSNVLSDIEVNLSGYFIVINFDRFYRAGILAIINVKLSFLL